MNSDLKAYKSNTLTKCTGTNSVLELERASSINEAFNSPTSTQKSSHIVFNKN